MTTNASLLRKHAKETFRSRTFNRHSSLDALDQNIHSKQFIAIPQVDAILDGIDAAIEFDLTPIGCKLCVWKGVNESEVKS